MTKRVLKAAFISSLPVLMGYTAMGMAAGILLAGTVKLHAMPFWAFLSSGINISGALQFIMVNWCDAMIPFTQVALLTFCLNVRYAMYGFSLIEKFRPLPFWKRAYLIWSLTDETYALEVDDRTPEGENPLDFCMGVAALDHLYWISGVVSGSIIGSALPFSSEGIEFAMTALFLVVLTDQCKDRLNRMAAGVGIVSAIVGRIFFSTSNMLIPAMIMMGAAFIILRKNFEAAMPEEKL
ncbi:MAG: hypothetical protein E7054_10415 [Lentisphaerae bacterium]|nr:hypothetical protein [Lentisphaerota bacterium]